MSAGPARTRRRLVCRGTVQGVGFRPAVYRLATGLGLAGWVRNDPSGATIEVEGPEGGVGAFVDRLPFSLPPLARLENLDVSACDPAGDDRFEVLGSEPGERRGALVPADTAPCAACRAEMEDPAGRRFRYPFTTCTDCGPRFSLVRALPYDRERTSMAVFPLCPDCRREYTDPADRRFHAEPVCCPACGPRLELREGAARVAEGPDALAACREALASGRIVAVKGLGGFQLACRADDGAAVARLRERKHRPTKPFALMARDLATARRTVVLDAPDETLLASPTAPVLLAPRRPGAPADEGVAPGIHDLGVMLPTTPLHVELFRDAAYDTLVMTSGNRSEEPICRTDAEALEGLADIADLLLVHDREVVRRVDDSVVRTAPTGAFPVRRARGFVPGPLPLPEATAGAVLALGPHLQATACLAHRSTAVLSQHVGDLDTEAARAFLREVAAGLEDFLQAEASVIAVDAHPDYPSTWLGEELAAARGARLVRIQHHLAHAAAVLAEHGAFPDAEGRAAALVLDGTGWGGDGTAWGGEWLLLGGGLRWRRLAHLEAVPLVGGERAVREPWRVAASALALAGEGALLPGTPMAALVPPGDLAAVADLARRGSWPLATGAGRLFEAAGALCGLTASNRWEGEAAARLESAAATAGDAGEVWPEVVLVPGAPVLPGPALLAAAAHRLRGGEPAGRVAAGFHETFCALAAELTRAVLPSEVTRVALGGGCLVNRLLLSGLASRLGALGLEVFLPRSVPPGDGGLAYGQAVLAAVAAARGVEPRFEGGS